MAPLSAQLVTRCLHKMVARLQIVAEPLVAITVSIMLATYFTYLRCFVVQSILHKLPLPHTSYMFKLLSCELSCKNMQEFCAGVLPESGPRHVVGIICVRQPDVFVFMHAQYTVVEKVFKKHFVRVIPRGQGETACQKGIWVRVCACIISYVFNWNTCARVNI